MRKAQREPGNFCPLIGKECIGWECSWYTHLRGVDNNTGAEVDHEGCSIAFLPMLLVENSNQQRATGAAVESFRNEMVDANLVSQQLQIAIAQRQVPQLEYVAKRLDIYDDSKED